MVLCACGKHSEIVMNILIVDDNEESLYFLEVLLKGNGHDVRSASNGAEALERIDAGGIDLIISDILMPVMDGFQLCRKVKTDEDLRHIPFIIYTSTYISPEDEAFAVKIGADRFIVKPCEPDVFMGAIQEEMAAVRCRNSTLTPEPAQEEEVLRLYNERLVQKLEQKILQLEKEVQARSEIEETLRVSERTLKTVFEGAIDGILLADVKTGRFVIANGAMCRMLGCSAEEIKCLSIADIHPAGSLDHVRLQFEKQVRGEISLALDIPVKRRDGSVFFADVNSAPLDLEGRSHLLGIFRDITERKHAEEELQHAFDTIKALKDQLEAENIYLHQEISERAGFTDIVGQSDAIRYAQFRIQQVAQTKMTVLLTGETGTGKGVFARALHEASDRKAKPFVQVNCAGLPANLIESELFGRERGAFTGSTKRQIGRFELANGGTIFLDEIGELPLDLQAKLLKVIESGEFERLGSPRSVKVDVRIVACSNRNIEDEVKMGRFRQDHFYRLEVFPITIPPLCKRIEDIPLLVEFYVDKFSRRYNKQITRVPEQTMKALENYEWPGNVRELINVVERAVILSHGPALQLAEKLVPLPNLDHRKQTLKEAEVRKGLGEMEREHILRTLKETGWKIEGPGGAAASLRMNPSTLRARMKKLGIKRPKAR
jgi:formate hydrogenlyase transcriptional activator